MNEARSWRTSTDPEGVSYVNPIALLRLLAAIVIALVALAEPLAAVSTDSTQIALAQGNSKSKGSENRSERADERANNDKDKKPPKDKENKKDKGSSVVLLERYMVDVACEFEPIDETTTCLLTGIAPDGGKDVGFVQIPETAICADVIAHDGEYNESDPHTRLAGYKSRDDKSSLALELDGEVTTLGTETYWLKAGGDTFPATGPGFDCHAPGETFTLETADKETGDPTAATEDTGTLRVHVFTCEGVPKDTGEFDWFGNCVQGPEGTEFSVTGYSSDDENGETAATGPEGAITFPSLDPDTYELGMFGGIWCHAKADNVTTDSGLVVEANSETNAYIFICDPADA
jgi:hypothetical protein